MLPAVSMETTRAARVTNLAGLNQRVKSLKGPMRLSDKHYTLERALRDTNFHISFVIQIGTIRVDL